MYSSMVAPAALIAPSSLPTDPLLWSLFAESFTPINVAAANSSKPTTDNAAITATDDDAGPSSSPPWPLLRELLRAPLEPAPLLAVVAPLTVVVADVGGTIAVSVDAAAPAESVTAAAVEVLVVVVVVIVVIVVFVVAVVDAAVVTVVLLVVVVAVVVV